MGKIKDMLTIDTVDEIYQYVNSFNEIQKVKKKKKPKKKPSRYIGFRITNEENDPSKLPSGQYSVRRSDADIDCDKYHEEQDIEAMERAKK